MSDMNCLCEGEVDDCEVLNYAVQPPSSSSRLWPGISYVVSALHFRVADGTLFSLLSNNDVSYMAIPFDNFDLAQAAHVKGIQSIAITGGQVPCLRAIQQHRGDKSTEHS